MTYTKDEIQKLEKIFRLNLINGISGVKPANLVGTKSVSGNENVAMFSSIVHLGSNPALLGFVMRPQGEHFSDTYKNILESKTYTINHVSQSFIEKAHYTSAKLGGDVSEFEKMKLESVYEHDFFAPFVKQSAVKIGMKLEQTIPLPNECIFIIGAVELLQLPEDVVDENGHLALEKYDCVGISGLNNYYSLQKAKSFPYVRESEIPEFTT